MELLSELCIRVPLYLTQHYERAYETILEFWREFAHHERTRQDTTTHDGLQDASQYRLQKYFADGENASGTRVETRTFVYGAPRATTQRLRLGQPHGNSPCCLVYAPEDSATVMCNGDS